MKFGKLLQRAVVAGALGASLCFALPAQAGTLIGTGYTIGSQQFTLSKGGPPAGTGPSSPHAGGFSGTWDGDPLQFWCAELTQTFGFGTPYSYTPSIPNNATYTRLGQLFTEAYGTGVGQALHDTEHSAAFQLAIWEILFDGTNLDLSGGSFKVTDALGHGAAVADAQTWLTNLGGFTDNYDIAKLSNESHQDFITGIPPRNCCAKQAPEPAPLALVGVGIVAMIIASRRRTPKVAPG